MFYSQVSERYTAHAVDLLKQLKTISQGFHDKTIPRSVAFTIGTEDQCESARKEHYEVGSMMMEVSLAYISYIVSSKHYFFYSVWRPAVGWR